MQELGSFGDNFLGADDLDDIASFGAFKVGSVLNLANRTVLPGSREVDTEDQYNSFTILARDSRGTGLSLQILQSRTTSTDLGSVLSLRNNNTNDNGLLENLDLLL